MWGSAENLESSVSQKTLGGSGELFNVVETGVRIFTDKGVKTAIAFTGKGIGIAVGV